MLSTSIRLLLVCFCIVAFCSCTKEGMGGKVNIIAYPKHHSKPIPNSMVYIKYGTIDFPGSNVSMYDDSLKATTNSTTDPSSKFESLNKGKYYLYSVGWDSAIAQVVSGGLPVEIKIKSGDLEVVIPVTE